MLKFKTDAGRFTPYLLLGPRIDFILSYDKNFFECEYMSNPNFGITMGFGCEVNFWKKYSLLTDIKYDYDFTSNSVRTRVQDEMSDVYSRSLEFLVGFKF